MTRKPEAKDVLRSVCVYCGSSDGADPAFGEAAAEFGRLLAESGLQLVYGGGSVGLMGRVARSVMQAGGTVVGIIPRFLHEREVMLREVTDLVVTEDMHERKRLMFDKADAFVALPGGVGTLEEVVEMMTWSQLGQHDKPIVLANLKDFWAPLHNLLGHMTEAGFISHNREVVYDVVPAIEDVIPLLRERAAALHAAREPKPATLSRL